MNDELALRALTRFDGLPADERRLVEALSVHDLIDAPLVGYTARALGLAIGHGEVVANPFVQKDTLAPAWPGDDEDGNDEPEAVTYVLRTFFRTALTDRLREAAPDRLARAHRLAAAYYHQPLEPLRTDRLDRYVKEARHLAAVRPDASVTRLAAFAHRALLAGRAEAAGRAATATVNGLAAPVPQAHSLADIIRSIAEILGAPDRAEQGTLMTLEQRLAEHPPSRDPAVSRIVLLGADLVAYYTERTAPTPSLTASVMPAALTTVDPRGLPAAPGWDELRMLQELDGISATIRTRTHRLEFPDRTVARHEVRTKLSALVGMEVHAAPRMPVIVDLVPWDEDRFLDDLHLKDRNGRPLNMLTSTDVKLQIARGVHRLLTSDGDAEPAPGREIARSLQALAWSPETEEITAVLRQAARNDDLDDGQRWRIDRLIRYMPVVALIDAHAGMSSEVSYDYDGKSRVTRIGWGAVLVSAELTFPLEVPQNRLHVVTPEGLEAAGSPLVAESAEIRRLVEADVTDGVQEFVLDTREDAASAWERGERLARIHVELPYVLPRENFVRALGTSGLCMLVSWAAAVLQVFLNPFVWAQVGSAALAAGALVVESLRKGHRGGERSPDSLYAVADKPLNIVRRVGIVMAIVALATTPLGNGVGFAVSATAGFVCAVLAMAVLTRMHRRYRLVTGGRPGGRELPG
ncbi:hypothetical protein ACIQ62_30270 [Streptomyces sp. NPDC096319]|uniref:hypothetical protein n=1 Tax=Streptomyces sp. NPDC096319 TaxID=3366084 RepID=UPI0037F57B7B